MIALSQSTVRLLGPGCVTRSKIVVREHRVALFCITLPHDPAAMIRKLKSGQYRLYSRKKNPKTGERRNLGTFSSRAAAERHEREVQYFKKK